jgi:hypothetical protein
MNGISVAAPAATLSVTATSSYDESAAPSNTSSPFFGTSRPTNRARKRSTGSPNERRIAPRSLARVGADGTPTGMTFTSSIPHCASTHSATAGFSVATTDARREQRPNVASAARCTVSSARELCGTKATCWVSTLGIRCRLAKASTGVEVA